jgi:hypothetical protein
MRPPTPPTLVTLLVFLLGLLVLGPAAAPALAENIVYPPGSGLVDLNAPPYSADPTGVVDATAAINQAFADHINGNRVFYLRNGTYRLTDTLRWGSTGGSAYRRTILQGQSRDGVILRLDDNLPAFSGAGGAAARPVIYTGPAPAQRFRNAVRNLTIHIGWGNPGASALQFNASNQGTVDTVALVSGDGQGRFGLDFAFTSEIGPLLVRDLRVTGFDYGIRAADVINSLTFDTIDIRHPRIAGILNDGQMIALRDYTFVGAVPALINGSSATSGIGPGGSVVLVRGRLTSTAPSATAPDAIINRAFLHVRDTQFQGFAASVINGRGPTPGITTPAIGEWYSHAPHSVHPSPAVGRLLSSEPPPDVPWDENPSSWANLLDYLHLAPNPNDQTPALQAAIDSGATTVLIPSADHSGAPYSPNLRGDIFIRGAVRRITGTEGRVRAPDAPARFVFTSGSAPVVIFERWYVSTGTVTLLHDSDRTLILANAILRDVRSTGRGDLYLSDVSTSGLFLERAAQRVQARQLNVETLDVVNIDNAGADLSILGLKTERSGTKILTRAGGRTELLGAHIYATGTTKTTPLFEVRDARATFTGVVETSFAGTPFTTLVRELRAGDQRDFLRSSATSRNAGNGIAIPLYTARGPLTPFQDWLLSLGLPADSAPNTPAPGGTLLTTYATAGVPPSLSLAAGKPRFTYRTRPDPTLSYFVETSPDLVTWTERARQSGAANAELEQSVESPTTLGQSPLQFFRLRVQNTTAP